MFIMCFGEKRVMTIMDKLGRWKPWIWFIFLWTASLCVTAIITYSIRFFLKAIR
jgi:hypothetical protein